MSRRPLILMVSTARSGTNHLNRLLAHMSGVHAYAEIFDAVAPAHYDEPLRLAFSKAAGRDFGPTRDPALGEWVHAHIPETLAILERAAPRGTRAMTLKVFHDHLSRETIEREFAAREGSRFLIVRRRPIDTYISLQKAMSTKRWILDDTTDLRPEIDADAFGVWHQKCSNWFAFTEDVAHRYGRPITTLSYERDIRPDDRETMAILTQHVESLGIRTAPGLEVWLKRPLRNAAYRAAVGLGLGRLIHERSHWDNHLGYTRQDRSTDPAEKVSNWDAFLTALRGRYDPAMLDDYFVADPPPQAAARSA